MPLAHLSIGTSDNRINLLNEHGYMLDDWLVGGTEYGTIFQESQLADFRQMAAYRDVTTFDTFELKLRSNSQDTAARAVQDMRTIVRLCLDFWSTTWQTSVVYLSARASCETNMRYAVAHDARLVGESNPFGQPFVQAGSGAVMDALNLIVERGPWLENAPGTGTCVEISSLVAQPSPYTLWFDGVDDEVDCGNGATVNNLPSAGNFTVEAWINPDSWGEGGAGHIFDKTGWELYVHATAGIYALADYGTDAISYAAPPDLSIVGEWHHIVAVWTLATLRWDIAVNGIWIGMAVQIGIAPYVGDAAANLIIGNNTIGSRTFHGEIGWSRISSGFRYTVGLDFTPPDRCYFPADDGTTLGLWIREGAGATAYDHSSNANDGTITEAVWTDNDCEIGQEATCDAQAVFAANKHNVAQLTHIYYWDDSANAWSANLMDAAVPFAFMPPTPLQVDDFVIFGIDTTLADSGPFSSLVLDIGTALAVGGGITIQWRGSQAGAPAGWGAITVQDNTNAAGAMTGDAFDTTGIGSVHWEQNVAWVPVNPNPGVALGVTGYWVAAYVTVVPGAAPSPPTQQHRDIYTVTCPYIEFDEDEVSGDMPALLRLSVDSRSAQNGLGATTDLWCQRIIAGLRSYERGENFTSFINVSDEQNNADITITLGFGMAAFGNYVESPTGRASLYTGVFPDAMDTRVYVRLTPDWYGRFHAFVRGKQATGAVGDLQVRLGYAPADSAFPPVQVTQTRSFLNANEDQLLDFGEIVLGPAVSLYPLEVSHTYIEIQAANIGTVANVSGYFWELILIPIDEWAVDAEDMLKNTGALGYTNDYWSHWEVDGIRNQRNILSNLIGTASGKIARYWRPITNGLPILLTGKQQRLWFLAARYDDFADIDDLRSESEICSTIQIWKQQRYSTLRGDR